MAVANSGPWDDRIMGTRLDFEDVTDSLPQLKPPTAIRGTEGGEMKKLQEEIDSIRRSLTELDAFSLLQKLRKVQEQSNNQIEDFDNSETDVSILKSEFIELTTKHKFLTELAEGKYDIDNTQDPCNNFESLQKEVMDIKSANGTTITEIESLIQTIVRDAEAMETVLNSSQSCLDDCDLKIEELNRLDDAKVSFDYNKSKAAMEVNMLKDGIDDCRFEELSLARQIEMKTRELEELENVAKLKDRYVQDNVILEALKGVSILGISNGHIHLQLKTYLSDMGLENFNVDAKKPPESIIHELHVIVDPTTLSIREAELKPKDLDISDIISAVQENHIPGDFFEKLAFIVKQVQRRISSHSRRRSISNARHGRKR